MAERLHSRALVVLRHRNFRLYFCAQLVSSLGSWVQITVENWLVLELSHSTVALGVTNALQFGPSVLLGLYGGVIADRWVRSQPRARAYISIIGALLAIPFNAASVLLADHRLAVLRLVGIY